MASSPTVRREWASSSSRMEPMMECSKPSASTPYRLCLNSHAWTLIFNAFRRTRLPRKASTKHGPMPGLHRDQSQTDASAKPLRPDTGPGTHRRLITSGLSSGRCSRGRRKELMTPENLTQALAQPSLPHSRAPGGGQAAPGSRTGREAGNLDQRADQRGCGNLRRNGMESCRQGVSWPGAACRTEGVSCPRRRRVR